MEVDGGPVAIEVRNLLYAVTEQEIRQRVLEGACRLHRGSIVSVSCAPRTGKATVELASQAVAEAAVAALNRTTECSFRSQGLQAGLVTGASQPFVQTEAASLWAFADESASTPAEQKATNESDLAALFRAWNSSRDGECGLVEFHAGLRKIPGDAFAALTLADVEVLVDEAMDKDSDGHVSLDEFLAFARRGCEPRAGAPRDAPRREARRR